MKKHSLVQKILLVSVSMLLSLSNILTPLKSVSAAINNNTILKGAPLNQNFLKAQSENSISIGGKKETSSKRSLGYTQAPFKLPSIKATTFKKSISFPATYDLRTTGKLTSIRDQSTSGSCWAFASLASAESELLTAENRDFSENNLKNNHGFDLDPNSDGGNLAMSTAYTARWSGLVNESDDPYNPISIKSTTGLPVQKHVQDVLWIPDRTSNLDNDSIKDAVMKYGAVYTSMHWEDNNYDADYSTFYTSFSFANYEGNNHAVNIVGWDDNFDKNKFYDPIYGETPLANGAFIVRNSWGTSFGEDGYFYISYYDANIGIENGVFNVIEPTTNYKTNYQYDPLGAVQSLGYGTDTGWFSNVFTASSSEDLSAAAFYTFGPNTIYEVYVASNYKSTSDLLSARVLKASGTMSIPGYHTINFDTVEPVIEGEKFAVIVKIKTPNFTWPIGVENQIGGYSGLATASVGQSYTSDEGALWADLTEYDPTANVCLKAFTTASASSDNYTVTFNSQGGSTVSNISSAYNSTITAPVAPTKTGYTFGGWYKEATCINAWNFTTDKVMANTTLYAKWTTVKVTGVSLDKSNLSLIVGQAAELIATINPSGDTNKSVTWTSDNTSVAIVDSLGKVTAKGYGTATINVKTADGGYTASCTVSVNTIESKAIEDFVSGFYLLCLSREADQNGLEFWKDRLLSKVNTGADVANSFIFSPEFIGENVSDDAFIDIMYKAFFDREGDTGGKDYWINKLDNGISRLYVLSRFVDSSEFSTICNSYGIIRGEIQLTKPVDIYPEVTAFTYRFYEKCLGRKPDDLGLNYWVSNLVTGQSTGADISLGFVFSPEFIANNHSNTDFITIMYRVFFDREPDIGGQTYWVNSLNAGKNRLQVLTDFINSKEFATVCNNYGISVGTVKK